MSVNPGADGILEALESLAPQRGSHWPTCRPPAGRVHLTDDRLLDDRRREGRP